MPYIKQELRPPFITAVGFAIVGNFEQCIDIIRKEIKNKSEFELDGCLNYVFTLLLKRIDIGNAKMVIQFIIREVFLSPPRYTYLERAIGLLHCMIDEFERRAWKREAIPALRRILNAVKEIRDNYEDEKIEANGDVE